MSEVTGPAPACEIGVVHLDNCHTSPIAFRFRCPSETAAYGSPEVAAWANRRDDQPRRTEAIRRLVEFGLKEKK